MTSTISEEALRGQQSRIMNAMRAATQPQPGSDFRDIASALTTQNQGGQNYFNTMRQFGQEQAKTNIDAETGIYNQMKEQAARGDAEAQAVDSAIAEIAGSDPKIYASILQDLHNDPENVNARNAKAKVMKYAADRGIVPLSVQEAKSKIVKNQRESSGLDVGPTGNIIQTIAKEKGISFSDAAYLYQTGFRQGTSNTPDGIAPLPGALDTKTNIKKAEKAGELDAVTSSELKKKGVQASNVVGLITEAKKVLPLASSGALEAAGTAGAKLIGKSTDASKADAQLKVIAAGLTSNVPRFEGPQGVLDVELYKQAAADVGNSEIPYEDRLAALDTMESLQQKYIGTPSATGATSGAKEINFDDWGN